MSETTTGLQLLLSFQNCSAWASASCPSSSSSSSQGPRRWTTTVSPSPDPCVTAAPNGSVIRSLVPCLCSPPRPVGGGGRGGRSPPGDELVALRFSHGLRARGRPDARLPRRLHRLLHSTGYRVWGGAGLILKSLSWRRSRHVVCVRRFLQGTSMPSETPTCFSG